MASVTPPQRWPAWLPPALAGLATLAVLGWRIRGRVSLERDELHSLVMARLIAAGDFVGPQLGSLTEYEGGSWLVAWPAAVLLRLGVVDVGATGWTAALLAALAAGLAALWLDRGFGRSAALAWTALLIVAALPLQDYGHRLWGSLHECLVFWPLLALGWTRWARSWSVAGGALLGVLLGVATVFSYLHAVTAVVLAGLTLVEGRRAAVQGLLACTLAASLVFGLWTQGVTYEQDTHLTVRDGWQLSEVARWLLLPRLDRVALEAVGTWHGPHRGPTTWSALSAVGLWILALGSAARGLRSQEGRVLAAGVVAGLLAAAVGSGFAGPPEGLRYHLPLLAALLAALASGGPRVALAGVVLAAGLHTATSRHPVERTGEAWLGLGAFTLLRLHGEPHRKFLAMLPHVPEAQRPIFAFGYGLDVGRELCPDPPPGIQSLLDPSVAWTFWPDDRAPELRWSYLLGLGAGLPEGCRLRDLPPAVSAPVQAGRGGTGVGLDRWLLDHAASIPR